MCTPGVVRGPTGRERASGRPWMHDGRARHPAPYRPHARTSSSSAPLQDPAERHGYLRPSSFAGRNPLLIYRHNITNHVSSAITQLREKVDRAFVAAGKKPPPEETHGFSVRVGPISPESRGWIGLRATGR